MQLVPFVPAAGPASRSEADATRALLPGAAATAPAAARAAHAPAPADTAALPRRGRASWQPDLQRQLSDAQQAQDFLDRTTAQLQGLKAELSAKLAGLQAQDGQLQAKLAQVASTWRARQDASAGSLDAQLRFSSPEPASQRFSVRGLDLQTLQSGGGETLSIAVSGSGRNPVSVTLDAGLSADTIVQRFDTALAPSGIRVGRDDSGALIFSVAESSWPAVRDGLAIKGGGIRFPTGQLHRVRSDPEPAAMQPDTWHGTDTAALRSALQQVVQALERVRQARASVSAALAVAASQVEQAQPVDAASDAQAQAQSFESAAGQPGYAAFSSVAAALVGVSRNRVLSLLALPSSV